MHASRPVFHLRPALFSLLTLLLLTLLFSSVLARPALAQSGLWTIQQTVPSLNNPLTHVLWVKSGTTNSSGTYSGDTISIWTMDATGHQMATSPTYGPYSGWHVDQLSPAFDGTLRMTWTKGTGTTYDTQRDIVSIWVLDTNGNRMYIGPNYGPYSGWHIYYFEPNPDGTVALYWVKNKYSASGVFISNQVSIWTLDNVGSRLSIGPAYSISPGWYFIEGVPSLLKDGTSYLTWVNFGTTSSSGSYSSDQVSIWKTDERGTVTATGPTYGLSSGWHFRELYPAYDGTARLLWTLPGTTNSSGNYTGDTAAIWSIDGSGHQTVVSPNYGPYHGWLVDSLVTAPSSTSRLLWTLPGTTDSAGNYSGDHASIWSLNAANVWTSISPAFISPGGTVSGGLNVLFDGSERLAWQYGLSSDVFSLWSLDASNNVIETGPKYGPLP